MSTNQALLSEFDAEMATTRKLLERLPEDKVDWKPHEKSMSLGRLAGCLAELCNFGTTILTTDKLDLSARKYEPTIASSREQVLSVFDTKTGEARAAIANASDDDMAKDWSMDWQGKTVIKGQRAALVRSMMLNHIIHHRGQFSVYLRLTGVPLPPIYGPSADESGM